MDRFSFFLFCLSSIPFHALAHTMVVNQTIRDGQTIVSPEQNFELGFFSPGNASENRYLGIWFKRLAIGTIVWVANRETPIKSNSGELRLYSDGVLVLRDSATNQVIWSSNTNEKASNPVARLLDSGNFMVTNDDNETENYIWQSFDYLGDTQIAGMKFGRHFEKGITTNFTSWKSANDPSQGEFMTYIDFNGLPQIFQKKGDVILHRLGSWNGLAFTGRPKVRTNSIYTVEYVSNDIEIYTKFELINTFVLSKLTLSPEGNVGRFSWINRTQGWFQLSSPTSDSCVRYSLCGPYGSCEIEQSPPCKCLKGFTPKRPDQWNYGEWNSGCQRAIPLDCGVGEGFRKYSFVKLPDTRQSWFDRSMTMEQCETKCRSECNCTAYATLDIKYGTGCLIWYRELMDMRTFPDDGQDIYVRVAGSELDKEEKVPESKTKVLAWIIVIPVTIASAILVGILCLIIKKRKRKAQVAQENGIDLPSFSMSTLLSATNNFSEKNKIGEGGFGPVYKGYLEDGQEVAVKRLSVSSTQGDEEFKNEVIFVSNLQHRNLVKILGCCIEGQEKLLIYEYMPNKSLDLYIYEEVKCKKLDWSQRYQIINGIARGLLYLHHDSRLRIIHRDLKAANILLDLDMNAKISDFGIARIFKEDETETNTKRVIGTYGYMSPEYAGNGIISIKSDVFSFGVIVLEIVCGKKNRGFSHEAHSHNLLGHVWTYYKEGKLLEVVADSSIKSNHISEVLRSIQVGLLCVQHNPDDRPNISEVVTMLSGKGRLSEPKQPGFYTGYTSESSSTMERQSTSNNETVTLMDGR